MSRRAPRAPGGAGSPWQKADTRALVETTTRSALGFFSVHPPRQRLAEYQLCVDKIGDAAALVGAVRHCQETGEKVPAWVVKALEGWLSEFVVGATPPKHRPTSARPRFQPWAKGYMQAVCDFIVADRVEGNRLVSGMTWEEALDEASCYFRGTTLAASPEALKKATRRARRRAREGWYQHIVTSWESRVIDLLDVRSDNIIRPACYWWIINEHRRHGDPPIWRERPRLLAHLSLSSLHVEAQKAMTRAVMGGA